MVSVYVLIYSEACSMGSLQAFVFATHLSIMSKVLTALGIEVHLETKWAIKCSPAGVLVAM